MKRDIGSAFQRAWASRARQAAVAAMLLGVPLLGGCAGSSARETLGGFTDRIRGDSEQRVAYAAVDRVKLRRDPDMDSPVVAVLVLHEKVLRDRDEGGFAHVEIAGDLSGWVPASQLVERLPRARGTAPKPAPEAAQTATEPAAPVESAEPTSEPTAEVEQPSEATAPDSEAEPPEPERSIFDPY